MTKSSVCVAVYKFLVHLDGLINLTKIYSLKLCINLKEQNIFFKEINHSSQSNVGTVYVSCSKYTKCILYIPEMGSLNQ